MKVTTILLTLLLATPSLAWGQNNAANQAAAQGLFDQAIALFDKGEFASACEKFEASLALVEGVGTKGKLAECYEKVGRTASAWAAYREVAVLAGRNGQTVRRDVATERAARLEPLLAYLTVTVKLESHVPQLQVTRNGVVIAPSTYDTAIAVDPGQYEIVANAPGYESKSLQVEVTESSKESVSINGLLKLKEEPPQTIVATKPPPPVKQAPEDSNLEIIGMATVGVGTLTLMGGVFLGLSAKSDYDGAFDSGHCDSSNACNQVGKTIVDDARSKANIGTIVSVSGLAIAGVGAYLWWQAASSESNSGVALQITPALSPESQGLSVSGQF